MVHRPGAVVDPAALPAVLGRIVPVGDDKAIADFRVRLVQSAVVDELLCAVNAMLDEVKERAGAERPPAVEAHFRIAVAGAGVDPDRVTAEVNLHGVRRDRRDGKRLVQIVDVGGSIDLQVVAKDELVDGVGRLLLDPELLDLGTRLVHRHRARTRVDAPEDGRVTGNGRRLIRPVLRRGPVAASTRPGALGRERRTRGNAGRQTEHN